MTDATQDIARATVDGAATGSRSGSGTLWAFTLTTFLSALLLFSIQPMFAKMVLPVLGGAPSVWAVAMFFFQAALLLGYCYAHALITFVPARIAGFIHLGLCLAAFVALPIQVPQWFGEPPSTGEPYLWQIGLFAVAVGLPFVAVAANAPLFQAWFAGTGHKHANDPYFLYAASNLGSLIALLAYPFVLEPAYGVSALAGFWTVGFGLLVASIALLFWLVIRTDNRTTVPARVASYEVVPAAQRPTWMMRLSWIGLALVPSALLTAFTTHVTTDVASAPMLWVLPLALYLLTFVLVFRENMLAFPPLAVLVGGIAAGLCYALSARLGITFNLDTALGAAAVGAVTFALSYALLPLSAKQWLLGVHVVAVVAALLTIAQTRNEGWFVTAPIGVLVFFSSAMVAHRTLYEARPAPRHLTEFYLWMSLGGALGGLAAALLAPRLFSEVWEYPILLALSMACRPGALKPEGLAPLDGKKLMESGLVLWILFAAGVLIYMWGPTLIEWYPNPGSALPNMASIPSKAALWFTWPLTQLGRGLNWLFNLGPAGLIVGLLGLLLLAVPRYPTGQFLLAAGMAAVMLTMETSVNRGNAQRSYFGIYRVQLQTSLDGQWNTLVHGTTLHGAQRVRDEKGETIADITPSTYYHPDSPMGKTVDVTRELVTADGRKARVGVIGLGSGSMACHARDDETWTFFEIDPLMIDIATKSDMFTYMENCQPNADLIVGDARLTLNKLPDASFDLIVVDAFSSDAVPVHLMTAEALKMYLAKLKPDGVALLHISNRYLDLDAVLSATAPAVPGLKGLIISDDTADTTSYAQSTSTVALFARSKEILDKYRGTGTPAELDPGTLRAWTDDYSDILGPFVSKYKKRF
jgi:SAM-dependent methyltransferase